MDNLPAEIVLHLASYCPIRAIVNLLSCNQSLHAYMNYDPLWSDLYVRDFGAKLERDTAVSAYIAHHTAIVEVINKLYWTFCLANDLPGDVGLEYRDINVYKVYKALHEHQNPMMEIYYKGVLLGWFNTIFAPVQRSLTAISRSRGLMAAIDLVMNINDRIALPYVTDRLQDVVRSLLDSITHDVCETLGIIAAIDMVTRVDTAAASLQFP